MIFLLFSRRFRLIHLLDNNPIKWATLASTVVKNEWSLPLLPPCALWRGEVKFYAFIAKKWKNCSSDSILWKGKIVDE